MVNYDPPNHHEDYVHRVGRTGRAGNKGTAITFIGPDEERYAPDLVKALRESSAPVPAVMVLSLGHQHQTRPHKDNLARQYGHGACQAVTALGVLACSQACTQLTKCLNCVLHLNT